MKENQKNNLFEEKIIQFGEGNFLRAFVDWMVQEMNEKAGFNGNVVLVQPINTGLVEKLRNQDFQYHVSLKGIKNGQAVKEVKLNKSISNGINPYENFEEYLKLVENPSFRFIISNTTEAGIAFNGSDTFDMKPASSFPGKLTQLLYHRFQFFNGDKSKGFIILPCELIENNAVELRNCIKKYIRLWKLSKEFEEWIDNANTFCNTLVDRIVPGFNQESAKEIEAQQGITDNCCVDAEQFHLWVIEGPASIKNEFPTEKAGLHVLYVADVKPYRTRKVRLLNGPHTLMVPVAYLSGIEYVREAVEHNVIGQFIQQAIDHEIIPVLNLPEKELKSFAAEVVDRFRNPFVKHALMSISLNSISKFKARLLPTLLEYEATFHKLPEKIVFSLSALLLFYKGEFEGKKIAIQDDKEVMDFFANEWKNFSSASDFSIIAHNTLKNESFWGIDLTKIPHLEEKVTTNMQQIYAEGMLESVKKLL